MINGWWIHWNVHWELHFTNQTIMKMIGLIIQHVRWSLEHLGWSIQSFSDYKLHIESQRICWVEQAQYLSALAKKTHFKVGCGLVVRNPAENLIPGEGPDKHRLYAGQIRNFHSTFWWVPRIFWILMDTWMCLPPFFLGRRPKKQWWNQRDLHGYPPTNMGGLPRRQPERPFPSLGAGFWEVEPLGFWDWARPPLLGKCLGDEHGIV